MAHRSVGAGSSIAINVTSAQSSAFSVQSNVLRVVPVGAGAHIAIGTNPTAATTDYYVPNGKEATLSLTKASNRIVGITTGTTTIVTFAEGTQCPFGVGDCVTLSGAQGFYNDLLTHQTVISVDTSSGVNGFHQTRCTIGKDTSGISTAFSGENANLKSSLKIAARTDTGNAVLHLQQVQISGQA